MRKKVLITVLSMTMLLGCSLTAEAVTAMGGTARVAKYTNATVYSSATGSYLGYASFGGNCTKEKIKVTAQYYKNISDGYADTSYVTIKATEKEKSSVTPRLGHKMWRVKVSEKKGRGIGWIKGE